MARWLAKAKTRILVAGVGITFLVAIFYGISLVQDGIIPKCNCRPNFEPDLGKVSINHVEGATDGSHKLCILVPFRDRFEELLEFAPHMKRFLDKQNINYKIIVINQLDKYRFNRASLINVGFLETRQVCDYIAMHDVDLLPLNDDLSYDFPEKGPYHLAAPHLHPLYHYKTYVGGILLLQSKHFEMLNGLSNKYWGWGREDDEFFVRMKKAKLMLGRPGNLTTGYKTFRHVHDRRKRPRDHNRFFDQKEWRYKNRKIRVRGCWSESNLKTRRLDKETGVSTVKYAIDSVNKLTVDLSPVTIFNVYLECDLDFTPWCLQQEDQAAYLNRKEKQEANQGPFQQQPPPHPKV